MKSAILCILFLTLTLSSAVFGKSSLKSRSSGSGTARSEEPDYNLTLTPFALFFIPLALLTLVYVVFVAAKSPHNASSHYLVDAPGPSPHGPGGQGGFGGGDEHERRSLDRVTNRVMQSIEKRH